MVEQNARSQGWKIEISNDLPTSPIAYNKVFRGFRVFAKAPRILDLSNYEFLCS